MTVVVTGASGGIGLGVARQLVRMGHNVYSFSRSAPTDEQINHIACSVDNKESVDAAFKQFFAAESRIDMLVCNAGIGISGAVEFTSKNDMRQIFDTNFFGAVNCCNCVISKMREQQEKDKGKKKVNAPKIVLISSVGSVFTIPFQTFYSATKIAVNTFAEGLMLELKPFGIKVGVVLPGDINSGFTKNRKKEFEGDDIYEGRISKSVATMERDEQCGATSDKAGAQIAKYLVGKKLRPYKVLGFKYKCLLLIGKLFPKKFVLWCLYQMYGA